MDPQFDHAVIFVSDLEKAIADFADLGFDVVRGGSHGSTENALIIFANQTYLELLGVKPGWSWPAYENDGYSCHCGVAVGTKRYHIL